MNRKMGMILILMILAISGVILFQAYWIHNTYKENEQQFHRDVNIALEYAMEKSVTFNIRRAIGPEIYIESDINGNVIVSNEASSLSSQTSSNDSNEILILDSLDQEQGKVENNYKISYHFEGERINSKTELIGAESDLKLRRMDRIIKKAIISYQSYGTNLNQVALNFENELEKRHINTGFELGLYRLNHLISTTTQDTAQFERPFLVKQTFDYSPVPEFVKASFPGKAGYVLSGMWFTLIASFLLIVIIMGSFAYMVHTIFRQKQLSEIKNDFINNMTHEFKTPIATVSAAVEALLNFNALNDAERTKKYLNISKGQLGRLTGMVEKVLNIASYEKEDFKLKYENFDLIALIKEIIEQNTFREGKNITINFNEKPEQLAISADKLHIQNVMNNLLDNGIKYSGNEVILDISCIQNENTITLNIQDHGVGISKEQQSKIFEKFYRVPTGDVHNVKGFGLGLSYVKNIIVKHGGTIEVESKLGEGSRFSVSLPMN